MTHQKPFRGIQLNRTHPLAKGLVGCWIFNEATGEIVFDLSGNGNNGALKNGVKWSGDGLDFDGGNDYVDCGSNPSLNDLPIIAIDAWICPTSFGEGNAGRIIDKAKKLYFTSSDLEYVDTLCFYHNFSTHAGQWHTPNHSIVLNQWQHIAVVYDNSTIANNPTMYINGVSQTLRERGTPEGTASSDSSDSLVIGNRLATDRTFDGLINNVRIYNRIVPTNEIAWLYRKPYAMFMRSINRITP